MSTRCGNCINYYPHTISAGYCQYLGKEMITNETCSKWSPEPTFNNKKQ